MIVLILDDANRVLSAARYAKAPEDALLVAATDLPAGDLYEYRYEDGAFIHDPLPKAEEPPTVDRVAELENRLNEMEAAYAEGVQDA
ncbi:MAG: hypothetical protein IKY91_05790 [Akkermansia sp.]|nr:hypothetical protein [Akkermansia sp.]